MMPSRRHPLVGFMHKLSTAVPQSSTLTARPASAGALDPPSGCPLDSSAYCTSTPAGIRPGSGCPRTWRNALIAAPAALRYENLCIIPARLIGVAGDLGAPACGSLVVADVPASPSPRSLISPRKPHQQTSSYLRNETLSIQGYRMFAKKLFHFLNKRGNGIDQKIFLRNHVNAVFLTLKEFKFQGAAPLVMAHQLTET